MNVLNRTLLLFQIHAWKLGEINSDIDTNADPLKILNDTESNGVDKYMRQIIRNVYSVILAVFVSGIAITSLYVLIKLLVSKEGKSRSEGKSDFAFKILLVIAFFALIPIVNAIISAVKQIIA